MFAQTGFSQKRAGIIFSLVVLSSPIAGVSAAPALKPPVKGDRITSNMSAKPGNLNPVLGTSAYDSTAIATIYETLLSLDSATNKWVGKLAKSWMVAKDGLTITVTLRPGVVWADGKPLTAEDVKYSFDTVKNPKVDAAHLRNYFESLQTVTVIGKDKVQFKFNKPYYRSLIMVGLMEIFPKHIFSKGDFNKSPANQKPVGSGPMILEIFKDNELRYKRNPRWWGLKNPYWNKRFNFKKEIYKVISNETAALAEHKRGGIDTMALSPKQWVRDTAGGPFAAKNNKYKYFPLYGNGYGYIAWNADPAKNLPFKDSRVRRAMSMALNRAHILKVAYFNLAQPATGPFAPSDPRTPKGLKPPTFNLKAAKDLLAQAGIKDTNKDGLLDIKGKPLRFTLLMPQGNDVGKKITQILQADLKKIGVKMEIRELEWTVFLEKVKNKDFEACMLAWGGSVDSDPYQIWHSSQIKDGDNFVSFKNARVDTLLTTARVTMDRAKRNKLYQEFASILAREQPYTFLFARPSLASVTKRFENTQPLLLGMDSSLWFTPKMKQLE